LQEWLHHVSRNEKSNIYNLDFRGLSARGAGGSPYRGGEGGGADGDGGGVGVDGSKTGSAPGSDPSV
ncbi:hypothetical protein ALC60_04545, partial [Trachymyrmex zeteki]